MHGTSHDGSLAYEDHGARLATMTDASAFVEVSLAPDPVIDACCANQLMRHRA